MEFSSDFDDLGKLVIQNMEIVETVPSVVDKVEKLLFAAINEQIKARVQRKKIGGGWDGVYELVIGKEDDTYFSPTAWRENDEYEAWYFLSYTGAGKDLRWLSNAIGVKTAALCLGFSFNPSIFDMETEQYRAKFEEIYNKKPILANHGFLLQKDSIIRPFHFDTGTLAKEFPDFAEALKPLDDALDDLFEVHPVFDKFVKGIQK